jgi:hypothetical protein
MFATSFMGPVECRAAVGVDYLFLVGCIVSHHSHLIHNKLCFHPSSVTIFLHLCMPCLVAKWDLHSTDPVWKNCLHTNSSIKISMNIKTLHIRKEFTAIYMILILSKIKVSFPLCRPWRPLGLPEVETPTFSDIRLTDGGMVFSPTRRPLFTPREIPGTHFS